MKQRKLRTTLLAAGYGHTLARIGLSAEDGVIKPTLFSGGRNRTCPDLPRCPIRSKTVFWRVFARFVLVLALFTASGAVQAQSPQQEPLVEVTVAIPGHFPPQYVITEGGELSGFAVDVADRVAALAGIRLTYLIEKNWQAATEAIRSGRAEVSINNGITEARKALYDYTAPVETFRVSIFVRKDTQGVETLDDLAGRKVAVEKTHVGVRLLGPRDDIELLLTDDTPTTLFALLSGQADAVVYAEPVIWKVAREAGVDNRIKVVGTPLVEIKRAMAVRKGNAELRDRLDRAVRLFVATAEYREIYAKWYGRPEPYWTVERVLWMAGALLLFSLVVMGAWRNVSLFKLNRALAESEANLADAQRIARLGSFEWDIVEDKLFWSDEIYRILKLDKETYEPSNEGYMSLIHPDDRAAVRAETEAALAECGAYDITLRILCSDGEERIIHDQAEVEADEAGRPLRMRGAFQDITERKRAEEEQQKLLHQLRQAQRIAKLDGWMWDARSDEVHFLGHGDTVHGAPLERLQGLTEKEYNETYMHPEDRAWVEEAYARLPETKETIELEYRVFDANGEVRTVFEIGEPMFDEAGAYIGNFGILQDITEQKQAERDLAEKTSLLDGLIKNSQTIITVKDPEGRYLHVNPEFEKAVGRTAEELKGMTAYDVFPRDVAEAQEALEQRAMESRGPMVVENELPRPDGETRSYVSTKIPVFDPQGKPVAMGTMALDITERKTAEERFRRYFELPLIGSGIYSPDKQWIRVNDKLCELLGYTREELTELTWADLTHPDDIAENAHLFEEALAGKRDSYSMDKRFIRKNGDILHTSISAQCLRKANGDPDYFIVLVLDLTERTRAEEALQESEESFRQMAENINQVLYLYEPDLSRTIYVNPTYEDMYGLSCENLYADPTGFLEAVDPEDRERVAAAQARQSEGGYDETYRLVHADGSRRWVRDRAFPVRDNEGGALRIVGIVEDVTEHKQAEDKILKLNEELEQRVEERTTALRKAQEELVRQERLAALGQLTGTVSHELRNPLGAMTTAIAAIKKLAPDGSPHLTRSIGVIDRSVVRCDNIIGDLLDYSRVRPLEAAPRALDDWVEALLDEYEVPSGVNLHKKLDSDATVSLDDDRFRRAVVNLLDNACQSMTAAEDPDNGERTLSVSSRLVGGQAELSVGDTGPGVDPKIKQKIFEPLYSTKSFGVGLGLPLVKRIVEQHDGGIEMTGEAGKGACFVIRLPLSPETKAQAHEAAEHPEPG